jgi:hypothetical protein
MQCNTCGIFAYTQICLKVNEAKRDAESAVITRSYIKRIYRSDGMNGILR